MLGARLLRGGRAARSLGRSREGRGRGGWGGSTQGHCPPRSLVPAGAEVMGWPQKKSQRAPGDLGTLLGVESCPLVSLSLPSPHAQGSGSAGLSRVAPTPPALAVSLSCHGSCGDGHLSPTSTQRCQQCPQPVGDTLGQGARSWWLAAGPPGNPTAHRGGDPVDFLG